MGKLSKEEMWRREGMSYAYRIAKEKGIEALEEDMKFRAVNPLPLGITTKAIKEVNQQLKTSMMDSITILTCITLRDEFGFGKKRVQQFLDRFESKADCIADEYCTWQDNIDALKEELGLDLKIRSWGTEVPVNKE